MRKTIPEIMMRDHARIHNLIAEIEKNINEKKNYEDSQHLFIRLKWTLEKHFFVEEKVVFTIYSESEPEEMDELNRLLQEHRDFLLLVKKIDEDFNNSSKHIEDLDRLMTAHAKFEDEIFYPRLEDELPEKQKQLIEDRCNEWV